MSDKNILLAEVFRDAGKHREVSEIISRHLVNKQDIRELALKGADLSNKKQILDLGCGFGFFTEALENRLDPDSIVTGIDRYPELEWFYLQSCDTAKLRGRFLSNGSQIISEMEDNSVDLVLSSYALYFFPEIIPHIPRILKKDGTLIAITHACPHMKEFTMYVRSILKDFGIEIKGALPYEDLIGNFCSMSGQQLLQPYFREMTLSSFDSKLYFGKNDFQDFKSYFDFKHSFFIPESLDPDDRLHKEVVSRIKMDFEQGKELQITKNDVIFICSHPL